jgi:tetratricopeptide (TPR) repeat protein
MERLFLVLFAVLIVLAAGSCTRGEAYLAVTRGNHAFSQGDYQEANSHYLHARELGIFADWVAYDLGTLYHALGEPEVAEVEWDIAAATESSSLLALVAYNYGVHLYELGRYNDAYMSFRKVLELNPDDVDAKLNLEYCLQKIDSHSDTGEEVDDAGVSDGESGQEVQMILEYVKRKETLRWKSTETIDEDIQEQDW